MFTEFGAKLSVSVVNDFNFTDMFWWNAYHEGPLLNN